MQNENSLHLFSWHVPSAKWSVKKKFVGSWRIVEIKDYDADYMDLAGPAKLEISTRGFGRMSFGAIEAELDCKMSDRDDSELHFSFEGSDEGDQISGRGMCRVEGEELVCHVFIHLGDTIAFRAKRATKQKTKKA